MLGVQSDTNWQDRMTAMASGGFINVALPAVQQGISKGVHSLMNLRQGYRGQPVGRLLNDAQFDHPEIREAIDQNPFARFKRVAGEDAQSAALTDKNSVQLAEGDGAAEMAHELTHLSEAKRMEPLYQQIAKTLETDPEKAEADYYRAREYSEGKARKAQNSVAARESGGEVPAVATTDLADQLARPDRAYRQVWADDWAKFKADPNYRPVEYKGAQNDLVDPTDFPRIDPTEVHDPWLPGNNPHFWDAAIGTDEQIKNIGKTNLDSGPGRPPNAPIQSPKEQAPPKEPSTVESETGLPGPKNQNSDGAIDRRAYPSLLIARAERGFEPSTSVEADSTPAWAEEILSMSKYKTKGLVSPDRDADFGTGVILLHDATNDSAKPEDMDKFIKFVVDGRGNGLARPLRAIAKQMDSLKPNNHEQFEDANNLIDYAYALPDARKLLQVASRDKATATDRTRFQEYIDQWGHGSRGVFNEDTHQWGTAVRSFKDELAGFAQKMKNAGIAQTLIDKAYAKVDNPGGH
jgi:hypothetical protein